VNKRGNLVITVMAVALIVIVAFSIAYLGGVFAPKTQAFTPHYLAYQGMESKIYVITETISYDHAAQDYTSVDGQIVSQGSDIFTIELTLRNDYSSENPPPTTGTPASPVDGTAYIRLKATAYNQDMIIRTVNVSPSDFSTLPDQTGLVLASGQTAHAQLLLATNQTKITSYTVTLEALGDSIQS
jgi:hypothetical protein